jgi:hypothetical protein
MADNFINCSGRAECQLDVGGATSGAHTALHEHKKFF